MKTLILAISASLLVLSACTDQTDRQSVTPAEPPETARVTASPVFYVSASTGNDNRSADQAKNAGTPWKTIQKAASTVPASATVLIAEGTYAEKVTVEAKNGTASAPVVFTNKPGETVILDGQNTGTSFEALFRVVNCNYLIVKGLTAQNGFWFGFSGEASQNLTFDACRTFNTRASGIYVKTSSQVDVINNNVRKACQLPGRDANGNGSQECISIVGCNNFVVRNNEVSEGLTVDAEGGEGIDAKGGSFNGEITQNYIHDLFELGIYIDAGSKEEYNIRVHRNRLYNTGGLSVAGEIGGYARNIYFYNNAVVNSRSRGFTFQGIGSGKFNDIYLVNNTFYNSARGEVANFSKNTANGNLVIKNNIFYNKTTTYPYSIFHDVAASHVISNNLYFDFKASNNGANSFTPSNLTTADVLTDPKFVDPSTRQFSLQAGAPAINRGVVITLPGTNTPLFTTDYHGNPRSSTWDLGAFEY